MEIVSGGRYFTIQRYRDVRQSYMAFATKILGMGCTFERNTLGLKSNQIGIKNNFPVVFSKKDLSETTSIFWDFVSKSRLCSGIGSLQKFLEHTPLYDPIIH